MTCTHTEHAVGARGRVGRYFQGLNDSQGSWEPCATDESRFAIESWTRLLASDIPRRNSEAESVLTSLLERIHPKWVLQVRTLQFWTIVGHFNVKTGHHEKVVHVYFKSDGTISGWINGTIPGRHWNHGVVGLADVLIEKEQ